jgi:putative flippase GtrA
VTMMQNKKEALAYLIFGILTTAINIVSYALLTKLVHMDYLVANTLAWIVAVLFAFFTNKLYVFKSQHTSFKQIIRELGSFLFFRLLSLLIDMGGMILLVTYVRTDDLLAKVVMNVFVIIFNYVASKYVIFAQKNAKTTHSPLHGTEEKS